MLADSLTFLTPLAGLVALAALLPAAAFGAGAARVARVRRALHLPSEPVRRGLVPLLAAVPLLLGMAATQPALVHSAARRVRTDAAVFVVVDVTRSMLASSSPGGTTRLARAREDAIRIRDDLPGVEVGVATLTDQVVPLLLPVADETTFADVVDHAVRIESPPPLEVAPEATSFGALQGFGSQGFFSAAERRRVVVLLTDGESQPYDVEAVAGGLGASLVVVRYWRADERVYVDGQAEPAYRPDPASAAIVSELVSATGGRSLFGGQTAAAAAQVRRDLGAGPTRAVPGSSSRRLLAPWVGLCALVPLAVLVRRRLLKVL